MFFKKKRADEPRRVRRANLIDGANAQPVFSYHARSARSEPTSERRSGKLLWTNPSKPVSPRRVPSNRPKRTMVIAGTILAIALVINSLFLSRTPSVVPLGTDGQQLLLRSQEAYQATAQAIFASSLANTNKLTIDTTRIAEEMMRQFPELEQVSVTLPVFGRQPVVYVRPAKPALLLKTTDGQLFILDQSGRAAAMGTPQAHRADKDGLAVVTDQSGLPVILGVTALPSDNIAFITEVIGQLKAKKLKVAALTLPRGASLLEVKLEGTSYLVKFNLRGDARAEAGAFLAVKQHLERQGKKPSKYIDVRVPNRAYYR